MKEYFTGIQHVGIPTHNLSATIDFYEGLGFETVHRTFLEKTGQNVAFLKLHSLVIEAYEQENTAMADGSIDHIAIDVHNIDALLSEVKAKDYRLLTGIEFLPFWKHGIKYFIMEGVNKERIEFCEIIRG